MRHPVPASLAATYTTDLCLRAVPGALPISVPYEPLAGKPQMECFPIVAEHVALHGGEALIGWAIWEVPGVFIEAEFHSVWKDASGLLHDLTPRSIPFEAILFLPDSTRQYRGRQVDNIRQPLAKDLDVYRYLYLVSRTFELMNAGDLAEQYGEISLPPKAAKEYRKVLGELAKLQARLDRRYP
ncbi:hypothetical protein PH586_09020 [Pseudomonas sp. SA3-5]|uniref:Uncharacterized protein n=1 Tax=Pseudomonas aestuarii TaxID=3018340 RepID=A0ABT4XE86_9PSED|nr:hypothetical protein [Pseudomonas aestuarii]MDA7086518.1 hypothetical protein [Pseudomonas aestuarii]